MLIDFRERQQARARDLHSMTIGELAEMYLCYRPTRATEPADVERALEDLGVIADDLGGLDASALATLLTTRGETMADKELRECLAAVMGASEHEIAEISTEDLLASLDKTSLLQALGIAA